MTDRTLAPQFLNPKKFKLPEPDIVQLDNGSRFFFLKVGDQPVIRLEITFRAGAWFETKPGVAFFAGKMLTEGTKTYGSNDISEKFDGCGAFFESNPGFDYTNFTLHLPTRHFGKIKSVLEEILFAPSFPTREFELMKQIQMQELSVNDRKNSFKASRLFRFKLFGEFPYGHVMTPETIENTLLSDIKSHFEQTMSGKFDVFLTGSFDEYLKRDIINMFAQNLQKADDFDGKSGEVQGHFKEYVEKENSLQSSIFMGSRSPNRTDDRYGQLLLLNEIFGGYFGSRLMQNIREDKGFTYGIHSRFVTLKNDAYFVLNSDVKKQHKDRTVEEIHKEIDRLKDEPVGDEELSEVKNNLKGSILNTLTTPFALADKLKNIYFYDLRPDFYEKLFDDIDAATSDQLLKLANETLFDKPLSQVIVG